MFRNEWICVKIGYLYSFVLYIHTSIIDMLAKYIAVISAAMLKFFAGPVTGVALGLSPVAIMLCSWSGMMLSIVLFVTVGEKVQRYWGDLRSERPKKKRFSKQNRRYVWVKQKAGLWGIALLTPILLSPIGGAIVSLAFRYPRTEIFVKMALSGAVCAILQTFFFVYVRGNLG